MSRGLDIIARAFASGELRLVESRHPDGTPDRVVWTRSEYRGALRDRECPGDHDGDSTLTPIGGGWYRCPSGYQFRLSESEEEG
ncbi:MAG TPA: hypothetical protein VFD01_06170 [Candidatus Dormibacteraeota bacterium]|jgi:hypothetical protein|nr:hypothetical protein [Candidatus Dormibacteraeota bacterium]